MNTLMWLFILKKIKYEKSIKMEKKKKGFTGEQNMNIKINPIVKGREFKSYKRVTSHESLSHKRWPFLFINFS